MKLIISCRVIINSNSNIYIYIYIYIILDITKGFQCSTLLRIIMLYNTTNILFSTIVFIDYNKIIN